ncbi:response regulator transcription factor [Helicobacter jaachi]|uniref:Response regulator transcription factor n=1 Tax=Helicobacter jaachi TaxID=1677920 RepID=A0A4U8TDK8_9HELI|nr:response regulator transcription factor [Helicobacter jaachi]TLD97764.1 response regulator transcription factor [Helicobacter jaachi]
MSAKILLLEDDFVLSEILLEFLQEQGYSVRLCDNAQDALECAYEQHFDLWVLDVKVPQGSGFDVLKQLRAYGRETPAIFITSLDRIDDLQDGYQAGCDDYLKKPFELLELQYRISTLLKRSFSHTSNDCILLHNGLRFGIVSQLLYDKNGTVIPLTQKEILLLSLLLQHRGSYVSQEMIFSTLWAYEQEPSEMSLRAYVKNLRKILGKDSILNQRGRGYCYIEDTKTDYA